MDSNIVLDATAFYSGFSFLSSGNYYTTQAVLEEVKHIKKQYGIIETLIESRGLQLIEPDAKVVKKVTDTSRKTGDYQKLSKADISIISAALQLQAKLLTDDYAVANVAIFLKIPVESSSGKGVKETRRWMAYCSACGKAFGPQESECPLCGNKLKRKYKITG